MAEAMRLSGHMPADSAGPLWSRIHGDLQRRLHSGELGPGFPGEMALAAEYGVSRHTIREALRGLRGAGVITAARGRSSSVTLPAEIDQPTGALYSLFAAVESAGMPQHSRVLRCDVRADALVANRLRLDDSTPLLYLERLRLAGGEPLAVDRVWLPASWATPLLDVDFTHTSLYEQMRLRCGVRLTGGQEQIRAVIPNSAELGLLANPPGVAALALDRLGCADGVPAEWRHTLIRGDRFSFTAQFTPRSYVFEPFTQSVFSSQSPTRGARP